MKGRIHSRFFILFGRGQYGHFLHITATTFTLKFTTMAHFKYAFLFKLRSLLLLFEPPFLSQILLHRRNIRLSCF